MIVQQCIVPLTFSKKESGGSSVLIEHFLKDAIEIIKHADQSFLKYNNNEEEDEEEDDEEDSFQDDSQAITWKLNLTPTSMTLDTNILTLSGLEKVLEITRINVKPVPPKQKERLLIGSEQYNMSLFQQIMEQVLELSSAVAIPRSDAFQQFNSMQVMKHCVDAFIECGYSFFLDVPSLLANTNMILSQPGAAKEHTVETLLILSISSLMVRHTMQHNQNGDAAAANTLMYNYYGQARQLLQDLFDVHHISVVQSMYILSIYPQGHTHLLSPLRNKSPLLDTAIRMAMAMDLHLLNIQHNEESDQKERLRRLAWMLFCADYFSNWNASEQTGLIDVKEWHVDFPQPLPSETAKRQVDLFSQYCRIVLLRKLNVFKTSVMISIGSGHLESANLDEQLIQSFFNTPDAFKLDVNHASQMFTSKSEFESLLLYELYCHTQIMAYIPFLPQYYFKQFVAEDESTRLADLNEIYQHFAKRRQPKPVTLTQVELLDITTTNNNNNNSNNNISNIASSNSSTSILPSSIIKNSESYCLAKVLKALNTYTLLLESATSLDAKGCSHNPVYGLTLTSQLYLIILKRSQLPEMRSVCQINLIRTLRIIRQVRSVYADPAILYIERMLTRYNILTKDEITVCTLSQRAYQMMESILLKSNAAVSSMDVKQEPPSLQPSS
ncbi:hypothetical protein K501DRAFT_283280 [Backusella circina FSU 941]|nr:hypothetical protein K501DRAFT_283280 [Backusella circina FSU 941]